MDLTGLIWKPAICRSRVWADQLQLKMAFVGCCVLAAVAGLLMGSSCEIRGKKDCSSEWKDGSGLALGAAGVLAAALARFSGQDPPPAP